MKRFMKILSLGAAVLMLAGSLAACSGKPGAGLDLISEGKLVMGTNAFFPPFEYKEGGEVVGVDVDIVKAIAEKLDLTFEVKGDIEFHSLPESLKAKDIDLIAAGFTARADREEAMDFSDSYATGIQSIIVPNDSDIASPDDLAGKKIGTQRGTTGYIYCSDDFGDDAVVAYDNGLTAVQALNNGQVDAVVIDNAPAKEYVAANPGLKVLDTSYAEEDYAIGMAKGSSLEAAVNAALEELKADGTLQAIVDKYITAE